MFTSTCSKCHLLRHGRLLRLQPFIAKYSSDNGLSKALHDAERFVGYPTRHSSLKTLFEEEPSNIFSFAKKLVGSGHPILTTVRDLLSETPYNSTNLGGMWVLLISRAAGNKNKQLLNSDFVEGIHLNQRILAETTDFIHTAYLFHRSMLNPSDNPYNGEINKKTINLGNNLCVLGGDLLLAKASVALAKLNNTKIVELMGICIGHLAEGSLLQSVSENTNQASVKDWENYAYLLQGSLIAHSCKSAVMITGHTQQVQEKAFEFGRHLDLLQQCHEDLECFQNKKLPLSRNNILLLLCLNSSKDFREKYSIFESHEKSVTMSKELRFRMESDVPDLSRKFQSLSQKYLTVCQQAIESFENKVAIDIINNILKKICDT